MLSHLGATFGGIVAWLGYASVLVLAFNLLPALPLDGGRIFRSILWWRKGDLAWATRITAATGAGLGGLMIATGLLITATVSASSGIWLMIIGWFVLGGSRYEARMASLRGALRGFVVSDLMSPHPIVSHADQTLRDFMAGIPEGDPAEAYPVLDGLRPVGILPSPRSLQGRDWATLRVRDRMLPVAVVLKADEPAPEAILAMVQAHAASALVMDHGHLAGIVSSTTSPRP